MDYLLGRYGPVTNPSDVVAAARFLLLPGPGLSFQERVQIVEAFFAISMRVRSYHTQEELLTVASEALRLARRLPGVLVECGAYKGGGTAKMSLVAELIDRELHVFDSFMGLPANEEPHERSIFGEVIDFPGGRFAGDLNEVKSNVAQFGRLDHCRFHPGWFSETMPHFDAPVLVAFLDVDLQASTRVCMEALYPCLVPGGVILSQDGHVPLVVELLGDQNFWAGFDDPHPEIVGLGRRKLVTIRKPEGNDASATNDQSRPSVGGRYVP